MNQWKIEFYQSSSGNSVVYEWFLAKDNKKMMTNKTITWDSVRDEILSDPEVKAEYDTLTAEFKIARIIVTLREKVGLTQREFADKVGMKQSQLARIESGKQMPKLQTLAKLAAITGYEVEVNLIPTEKKTEHQIESLRFNINLRSRSSS